MTMMIIMMTMMMMMMIIMHMICTAGQLKWAGLGVKGEEPQLHRAKQADCQSDDFDDCGQNIADVWNIEHIENRHTHIRQSSVTVNNLRIWSCKYWQALPKHTHIKMGGEIPGKFSPCACEHAAIRKESDVRVVLERGVSWARDPIPIYELRFFLDIRGFIKIDRQSTISHLKKVSGFQIFWSVGRLM